MVRPEGNLGSALEDGSEMCVQGLLPAAVTQAAESLLPSVDKNPDVTREMIIETALTGLANISRERMP